MDQVKRISQIIYEFKKDAHTVSFSKGIMGWGVLLALLFIFSTVPFIICLENLYTSTQVLLIALYVIVLPVCFSYLQERKTALIKKVNWLFEKEKLKYLSYSDWKRNYDSVRIVLVKKIIECHEIEYLNWLRDEIVKEIKKIKERHLINNIIKNPANVVLLPIGVAILGFLFHNATDQWNSIMWIAISVYIVLFMSYLLTSVVIQSSVFYLEELEMDLRDIQNELYVLKNQKVEKEDLINLN